MSTISRCPVRCTALCFDRRTHMPVSRNRYSSCGASARRARDLHRPGFVGPHQIPAMPHAADLARWPSPSGAGSCNSRPRPRHVGDGVAFIVAETGSQALEAAEAVHVDYEVLPAVMEPGASPPQFGQMRRTMCVSIGALAIPRPVTA